MAETSPNTTNYPNLNPYAGTNGSSKVSASIELFRLLAKRCVAACEGSVSYE